MPSWFDRFGQEWARLGLVNEPSISQADAGFAFIGQAPPTVELFNALSKWSDAKDNWLFGQIANVIRDHDDTQPSPTDLNQLLAAIKGIVGAAVPDVAGFLPLQGGRLSDPGNLEIEGALKLPNMHTVAPVTGGETWVTFFDTLSSELQANPGLALWQLANNRHYLIMSTYSSNPVVSPNLEMLRNRGTNTSPQPPQAGDEIGSLIWGGEPRLPGFDHFAAGWSCFATQTFTTTRHPTRLEMRVGSRNTPDIPAMWAAEFTDAGDARLDFRATNGQGLRQWSFASQPMVGFSTFLNSTTGVWIYSDPPQMKIQVDGWVSAIGVDTASDRRGKANIRPFSRGLKDVLALKPSCWNNLEGDQREQAGLVAQDLEDIIPEAVRIEPHPRGEDPIPDRRYVSDWPVMATLINAVKELAEMGQTLQQRLQEIDQRLAAMGISFNQPR